MLTLAEFYSIADSSTAAARIPILIAGGCWARSQLHNGIKYVSTPAILMELLSALDGVPKGGARGGLGHVGGKLGSLYINEY